MNQPQTYMEHAPASAPGTGISQYGSYGAPQALQPASQSYAPSNYGAYQYPSSMAPMAGGHPVTSSMGSGMVPQALPLPTMATGQPAPPAGQQYQQQHVPDTTGQIAPPGMKPRVTATLWEDEGSLCFQVEAKGVCVARREDNHMINGTKLLNVAGMTRGRRDGILKSEKTRHVVKIGPMHLKGVWIPFDRALDFANKERITELLYPLFVHNIGALLYHPTNQARQQSIGNAAMAARRPEQQPDYMRTPTSTQPPSLTHHHSMSNPSAQPPHSVAPHPASGRPGLDRAHTFPTPPASASSMTMNMGNQGSSYEYNGGQAAAMQSGQHIPVNGVVSRSMPTTPPASTSPGSSSQMQYPTTQAYDASRPMYSAPGAAYPHYAGAQYGHVQPSPGVKNEMAPPARAGAENEHADPKAHDAYSSQHEGEGEHEGEYTHTSASYGARKASYGGLPNAPLGSMHSDSSHISPEMTHSPHQNGSGRATPRTTATYPGPGGYSAPQRQLPASNLYSVISNDARAGAPNGAESYQAQGYPAQYPSMNGVPQSNKRGREDEDEQYGRPLSANGIKRARTDVGSMSAARPIGQQQPVKPIR